MNLNKKFILFIVLSFLVNNSVIYKNFALESAFSSISREVSQVGQDIGNLIGSKGSSCDKNEIVSIVQTIGRPNSLDQFSEGGILQFIQKINCPGLLNILLPTLCNSLQHSNIPKDEITRFLYVNPNNFIKTLPPQEQQNAINELNDIYRLCGLPVSEQKTPEQPISAPKVQEQPNPAVTVYHRMPDPSMHHGW